MDESAGAGGGFWQWGAMWLAGGVATATLVVRLVFGSEVPEAVAIALLAGVVVFALAYVANERPIRR